MPNNRDRCEESELPVLLDPVRHVVEQIRLETAVHGERREHRVLDPPVILASKLDLGQMIREQRAVGHAIVRRRVGHAECIGGDGHEDLARERVVPHVQIRNIGCDAMGVIAPNEAGQQSSWFASSRWSSVTEPMKPRYAEWGTCARASKPTDKSISAHLVAHTGAGLLGHEASALPSICVVLKIRLRCRAALRRPRSRLFSRSDL